ncbi:DUF6578 domain-containing protein [Streptomyces sp. NPDC018031]|uniref:DUF6578 domain-containing protein n=1 Tax=Streptomyces sp. NPDC018031 TaxID=3365033 RepID=UPI00378DC730
MTTCSVFYQDWQMECCGKPFSVGEEVSWQVVPLDPADRSGPVPAGSVAGPLYAQAGHPVWPGRPEPLTGRVSRIRVVTQGFEAPGPEDRTFRPVPGDFSLRQVDTCPKWFRRDVDGDGRRPSGGRRRDETGVLVEIARPTGGAGR